MCDFGSQGSLSIGSDTLSLFCRSKDVWIDLISRDWFGRNSGKMWMHVKGVPSSTITDVEVVAPPIFFLFKIVNKFSETVMIKSQMISNHCFSNWGCADKTIEDGKKI